MKQYRILILSNMEGSGLRDDQILQEAFVAAGHQAEVDGVNYPPSRDEDFDVIIRRNTWTHSEDATAALHESNKTLIARLTEKGKKTVNLLGLDGQGKGYLCQLFHQGRQVIPTINTMKDLPLLPPCQEYVMKDVNSFGNGLHQRMLPLAELQAQYQEGNIIQPKLSFVSELQCYYVGRDFYYAFSYSPSKFPDYPEPQFVELSPEERALADEFVAFSQLKQGFLRIDFLRFADGSLSLMEIEDHSPFMNLIRLPSPLQDQVVRAYVKNVLDYLGEE